MKLIDEVATVLSMLNDKGYEAYLVGGAVRNILLDMPINDYDIATNADPNAIKMIFADYVIYDVGKKHGTVAIIINKIKIEITPYRKEADYIDHRHPQEISFDATLEEDLKRRDFTINAMCLDKDLQVIDLFGGIDDLKNKTIRAIGSPAARFHEDALRILRALRFKAKLDFEIEENTRKEIFNCLDLLRYISNERKREELLALLSCKKAFEIINEYLPIFNSFMPLVRIDRKENDFSNPLSSLAYLLANCDKTDLKKLKYSKDEISLINILIEATSIDINDDYQLISILSHMHKKQILEYLQELHHIDLSSRYDLLSMYIVDFDELNIDGNAIKAYGYEGKDIARIKKELLEQIHQKKLINDSETLNAYLLKKV